MFPSRAAADLQCASDESDASRWLTSNLARIMLQRHDSGWLSPSQSGDNVISPAAPAPTTEDTAC
jgi:hypothetical protein